MKNGKLLHLDLFSGIGGFALAADRVFGSVEHIFCDNEPFAQEVLKKHWPDSPIFGDIRTLTQDSLRDHRRKEEEPATRSKRDACSGDGDRVYLLTGGFPCQPFSQAGRRKGEDDDRFLWPEMCRVIGEFRPGWVIAENVRGLLTQGGGVVFERVCTDLEALGYEVWPIVIPAVAVGAPHRRDRVWFVAHSTSERGRGEPSPLRRKEWRQDNESVSECEHPNSNDTDTFSKGLEGVEPNEASGQCGQPDRAWRDERPDWGQHWLEAATRLCRVDDGIPRRMDRNPRLKALGNAIVPQVAEEIMRTIKNTL